MRPEQTIKDDSSLELIKKFKRYDDGSYVTGTWNHGIRHGLFTFDTNKQESEVRNIFKHRRIVKILCRCHILRASTRTIAWKAWHGSFGRTAPGQRDSSRAASFTALPGDLTLTSTSRSSGCTGGLSFFAEFSGFIFVLSHRNGKPFGTCWKLFRWGGSIVGRVDEDGEFTGRTSSIVYFSQFSMFRSRHCLPLS